jgi:AraC-like DNA-binding protein/proteasome lid subunit RPN8/RPN11
MLIFDRNQYNKIVAQARAGLPHEVCGLLAGIIEKHGEAERRVVKQVYPLTNTDESAQHFSMDPKEQFRAVGEMRENGLSLLGNYHSHPSTPARPSAEDIRLAFDPNMVYAIISLKSKAPNFRAFKVENGAYESEELFVSCGDDEEEIEAREEIVRAFDFLIGTVGDKEARRLLICARQHLDESGNGGSVFFLPPERVQEFVFPDAPELVRKVCSYILSFPEAASNLQSIAARFGVNNTYLSNLFKQKTGVGFNEYLTRVKVARAKYYLEYTDRKIGDICDTFGFADREYFNRLFKNHTGLTLTAYRKELNERKGETSVKI